MQVQKDWEQVSNKNITTNGTQSHLRADSLTTMNLDIALMNSNYSRLCGH